MNKIKLFLQLAVVLSLTVLTGCFHNNYDWKVSIPIPYLLSNTSSSEAFTISMWSARDDLWVPEKTIHSSLSFNGNNEVDFNSADRQTQFMSLEVY